MNSQTIVSEDETNCDFSSILDSNPLYDDTYERPKSFFEEYLTGNPDVVFTRQSITNGLAATLVDIMGPDKARSAMEELKGRWDHRGTSTMTEPTPTLEDPVGDMIRHFAIFYEHVVLLEGYPKDVQPQLSELKLLGIRIHKCLIQRDGTLNTQNVKRCEVAGMTVTLENGFIQVTRGKAVLRQRV